MTTTQNTVATNNDPVEADAFKEAIGNFKDSDAFYRAAGENALTRHKQLKEDLLQNIRDARNIINYINGAVERTEDKNTLYELDEIKVKMEEVIRNSEAAILKYN